MTTLIIAFHQPLASFSLALEYTSISWFNVNSCLDCCARGGRRTCENGNLDSGCQLKIMKRFIILDLNSQYNYKIIIMNLLILI